MMGWMDMTMGNGDVVILNSVGFFCFSICYKGVYMFALLLFFTFVVSQESQAKP